MGVGASEGGRGEREGGRIGTEEGGGGRGRRRRRRRRRRRTRRKRKGRTRRKRRENFEGLPIGQPRQRRADKPINQ
jgi:hypothetical protein